MKDRVRPLFQRLESVATLSNLSMLLVALILSFPASGQGQILLDGDFDELTVGTAPDRGTPNAAWSFPDSYGSTSAGDMREPLSRKEILSVVETSSFDATRSGNSLKVQISGSDSVVLVNMLSRKVTEADGGILRVKFDTFVPPGAGGGTILLGSNPVGFGGISYWTDQGPVLNWQDNGRLAYLECVNFLTSCDPGSNPGATQTARLAVDNFPRDLWQHVQLDIDLVDDKYDLYHSAGDEPLNLVKSDLGFSSGKQREIDRLLISGAWAGGKALAYFDNFDVTWAPSTPYETVALSGAGGVYLQDFDAALGMDSSVAKRPLPKGWIGSREGLITTDKTTKTFPQNASLSVGTLLYNAGADQGSDRALAIGIGSETSQGTLQLLANVTDANAEQLQLSFDLEVWDVASSTTTVNPGEAAFDVSIDIDQGDGFVQLLDLGRVTTGPTLQKPLTSPAYLDGNDPAYRVTFDSGLRPASIPVGSQLRVRWSADQAASRGWIFGLDNVNFRLLSGGQLGDFNSDGILGIDDLDQLSVNIAAGNTDAMYDLDRSGVVNLDDRQYWVTDLKKTWIGDTNLDGAFNSNDLIAIFAAGEYEDGLTQNSTWSTGDWNGDREVDSGDIIAGFSDGGYEAGPRAAVSAVPEPSSALLLVAGLLLMARRRKS